MSAETIEAISAQDFRTAMRKLASGVSLVTCRSPAGAPLGMLATAVTSVSADPATLLVCINRSATMYSDLLSAGTFCVNFLPENKRSVADRFASGSDRDSRFSHEKWMILSSGAPALVGAMAALDCAVMHSVDAGTHTVLFGKVIDTAIQGGQEYPLVYFDGSYGRWARS